MQATIRRTTIADVAKAAGVSKTAVSFAFNAPDRLSSDTVTHIHEIATAMGYRPDPVARSLAQRRTGTLGILTPQSLDLTFNNPYHALFAAGVAAEAERAGLVSRVVPAAELLDVALKAAEAICAFSGPSVRMAKEAVNRSFEMPLSDGIAFERHLFHSLFATEDKNEGMAAFLAKRKAEFKNR